MATVSVFHNNGYRYSDNPEEFVAKNIDGYGLIGTWLTDLTGEKAAEDAFDMTNNPSREKERELFWKTNRSISVGDVVIVNNHSRLSYFLCMPVGWKNITDLLLT